MTVQQPTAIRIAARPFTSPCAPCGTTIPEELNTAVFALADDHVKTVCDDCARAIDPDGFAALTDLRRLDERYWEIYNRDGIPGTEAARDDANAYLTALLEGAAALHAMYLTADQAQGTLRFLADLVTESGVTR